MTDLSERVGDIVFLSETRDSLHYLRTFDITNLWITEVLDVHVDIRSPFVVIWSNEIHSTNLSKRLFKNKSQLDEKTTETMSKVFKCDIHEPGAEYSFNYMTWIGSEKTDVTTLFLLRHIKDGSTWLMNERSLKMRRIHFNESKIELLG